jgi:tetratricopeptide (TPR) repeat protein
VKRELVRFLTFTLLGTFYFSPPIPICKANALLSNVGAPTQAASDARELRLGERFEREMSAGQTHSYKLALNSGQYLKLFVEQRGINVALTLLAPDGKKLTEINGQKFRQGIERLYWVTDSPGSFLLEIRSVEKDAPDDRYEVRVEEIRNATDKDRLQVAAVLAYSEAAQLEGKNAKEFGAKTIAKYEEALRLYRDAGDKRGEGAALHRIGRVYWNQDQFQKAVDYFNQALPLYREAVDRQGEGSALSDTGGIYGNVNWDGFDRKKALDCYDRALPIAQAIGDKELESRVLYNKAMLYDNTGDWQKAIEVYQQSLPPRRASGDRRTEAGTLNNLGMAYFDSGEPYKALEYFNQALPLKHAFSSRGDEAGTLHNIGMTYLSVGDYQRALDTLNQVLSVAQSEKDRLIEVMSLHTLAMTWKALGDLPKALELFGQVLQIARQAGFRDGERSILINMGNAYTQAGDYQKALSMYYEALLILIPGNESKADPGMLGSIGEVYLSLGDKQKALRHFEQAMSLYRDTQRREKTGTLRNLGRTYLELNDPGKALDYLNQSLQLGKSLASADETASNLLYVARAEKLLGKLAEAREHSEAALAGIESLRAKLIDPDLRALYFATQQDIYSFNIALLMQLHKQQPTAGYVGLAFEASESRHARSLLELMASAHADIRQGVDPSLLEQEKTLEQRINAKQQFRIRLLGESRPTEQVSTVEKEIDALMEVYRAAQDQIRKTSPHYAALTQPQRSGLKEIQGLLEPDTLLLEYSLGEEQS